jgi:hypothetical protein
MMALAGSSSLLLMDPDGLDVETMASWIADGKGWRQMVGAASGVRVVGIH